MADDTKRLIKVRSDKSASFKRDGAGKKKQLSSSWRKPRGLHSKKRIQKKAKGALPTPGFGSPVRVRNMHPSGFREIRVFTLADLDGLTPDIAIRIGASVGKRKRLMIQERALSSGLKILNPHDIPQPEPEGEKND